MTKLELFSKIYLPHIKKSIPSTCSFLSIARRSGGEYYLKAIFKRDGSREEFDYSLPQDFTFTNADLEHIIEILTEECQPYVAE